ncbi:MAG TPA: phosphotransferase [Xanthomonadaceae bacterium]|nr:phosphotransferase [Xanthomonadaceae bacterium]
MSTATDDARATRRLEWTRTATAEPATTLSRASVDAGFRSYWRAVAPGTASRIVMDSPPGLEDVRPWLRVHALLDAGGVRVPRVLASDVDAGLLLLEDLGADTYLHVLDDRNADRLFDDAITQLLRLQAIPCPDWVPHYDEALLSRELRLFDDWFLQRHLGVLLQGGDRDVLDDAFARLVAAALAQPCVLVHRDYMPRNLMPADGGPAVLDFQDAVRGPVAYDVLSLFKDAFASWPEARFGQWIGRYHARASAAGLPVGGEAGFRRDVDWIGVQRHLKVLGIFARLSHRDGKPKYLADAHRFLAYLDTVLSRQPDLAPLQSLLERRVRPALAGISGR